MGPPRPSILVLALVTSRCRADGQCSGAETRWADPDHGSALAQLRSPRLVRRKALTEEVLTAGAGTSAPGGGIPSLVHFTGPWEPMEVVRRNRAVVPKGTEFRYYNNSQLVQSVSEISRDLEQAGVSGAADAFMDLRPWAYRADLWRYMILWQSGGVYLDAKVVLRAPLSTWVDQARGSFAACLDHEPPGHYWNAMLAARRRDPTLLAVIRQVVSHVQARYYPPKRLHADLDITGPGVLTWALNSEPAARPRLSCHFAGNVRNEVRSDKSGRLLAEVDASVHQAMHQCANCHTYGELFNRHQVYCSEPGPECELSLLATPLAEPYWSYVV